MQPITAIAEIYLLLDCSIRTRNVILFRETISTLYQQEQKDVDWVLKTLKLVLTPKELDWLEGACRQLQNDDEKQQAMPYTAHLWKRREQFTLAAIVKTRVNLFEERSLAEEAQRRGMTIAELSRNVLRKFLANPALLDH